MSHGLTQDGQLETPSYTHETLLPIMPTTKKEIKLFQPIVGEVYEIGGRVIEVKRVGNGFIVFDKEAWIRSAFQLAVDTGKVTVIKTRKDVRA